MSEMLLTQLKSSTSSTGLVDAVNQCIHAAAHESNPTIQKVLLKVNLNPVF